MTMYYVCNDYSLEKTDESPRIFREKYDSRPGQVNHTRCVYYTHPKGGEKVAIEVDRDDLDGYVLGNT